MSGITNGELEKLCKKFLDNKFLGVFPSDVIPKSRKLLWSIIFNLSAHDEEGSHFIAIIKRTRKIFYFDSFGRYCTNKNLLKFIKSFGLNIEYNTTKIQDDNSSLCGYYCFYFLHEYSVKNVSYEKFISKFVHKPNELLKNDTKLMKLILENIKKKN